MITIRPINTSDKHFYQYTEELLISTFPFEERRDNQLQRDYSDYNRQFSNNIILNNDIPVGLLIYWDFYDFIFIEHFAVDPLKRSGGTGKTVITMLNELLQRPIILEVELPKDENTRRRIGFYHRLGFTVCETNYLQPPYHPDGEFIPMYLMGHGFANFPKEFKQIKTTLYREVYRILND
jgi:ribosomal protein S18 acetylase RimI-like enzyme